MVQEIRTEIDINASAEDIYSVLMDFESYPDWNPFVKSIEGDSSEKSKLKVYLQSNGSRGMNFTPKVTSNIPNQRFSWLGRLVLPKIFDGEHIFEINATNENKVHFVHREEFSGILVRILLRFLRESTQQGFEDLNQALKNRVENNGINN